MKNNKKILILIRRYHGDLLLCKPLIDILFQKGYKVDLLVNGATIEIAKIICPRSKIYPIYKFKGLIRNLKHNFSLLRKIFRQYDFSISLTTNDRSVLFAILSARKSISVIDEEFIKSFWKKILLDNYYLWNRNEHIILNNLKPLKYLGIGINQPITLELDSVSENIQYSKFAKKNYIIFHPCAKYSYKTYKEELRNKLIELISKLDIEIVVTGGNTTLDKEISDSIPRLKNVHNLIGRLLLKITYIFPNIHVATLV